MTYYEPMSLEDNELAKLSFLTDQDIAEIMQLKTRIRNVNIALDILIESKRDNFFSEVEDKDQLNFIRNRMNMTLILSKKIIERILKRNKELKSIIDSRSDNNVCD